MILASSNSSCSACITDLQSLSLTTNAKFSSEEPCAIIITFTFLFCTAENTLDAIPTVPLMPEPITAIIETFGVVTIFLTVFPNQLISSAFTSLLRSEFFTLIEILISAAIISLVAIAVYSVFASGIGVWRRGNESRSYERNIRRVSEKLTRELRNTFKFSNIAFEGTEDSIAFAGLVENEVGRISYFLNDENVFCRQQQTYPEALQDEEMGESEELIPEVAQLSFSYCYLDNATGDYKWKESWVKEEQDTIPRAVKIELFFGDEAEPSTFVKTIFIPIGTGEQKIELGEVESEPEA